MNKNSLKRCLELGFLVDREVFNNLPDEFFEIVPTM